MIEDRMRRILLVLIAILLLGGIGFGTFLALHKPEPPAGAIEIPVPAEKVTPQ